MAKKNSTKTATKEAMQATEPRVQVFNRWAGVSIQNAPVDWEPTENFRKWQQSDLVFNFNVLQNNLVSTAPNGSMQTREPLRKVVVAPANKQFSGVAFMHADKLLLGYKTSGLGIATIAQHTSGTPAPVTCVDITMHDPTPSVSEVTDINRLGTEAIVLKDPGETFTGEFDRLLIDGVSSCDEIADPTAAPTYELVGVTEASPVAYYNITYCYTNRFGSTKPSAATLDLDLDIYELEFTSSKYVVIKGAGAPAEASGVDIYATQDDSMVYQFIGHTEITNGSWRFNWLGAMEDVTQWTHSSLSVPTENTTRGPLARYLNRHDGRLFFWTGDMPYSSEDERIRRTRLLIGGNPGNELSVARGLGGAFLDIEPGLDGWITGTHKFKTYNGATIITCMCGHRNTSSQKRYNLLEDNITLSNERQSKSYMYEEVSNVVGCNSRWGSDVIYDGLYAVNRYGVAVTTQAMESSNQLRIDYISDNISSVFTEALGDKCDNARMVEINGIIYVVFDGDYPHALDNVLLCYDIALKAWYTLTLNIPTDEHVLHIFKMDWDLATEGLGIVTETGVWLLPTTMDLSTTAPDFDVLWQTGEIAQRTPVQEWHYLSQIELDFDFIVGQCSVEVTGTDYYGRDFRVHKYIRVDEMRRSWREWIRIDKLVRTYRVRLVGPVRMRLVSMLAKVYAQSRKIDLVYGFDDRISYVNRDGGQSTEHHYLDSYNSLRDAIVP